MWTDFLADEDDRWLRCDRWPLCDRAKVDGTRRNAKINPSAKRRLNMEGFYLVGGPVAIYFDSIMVTQLDARCESIYARSLRASGVAFRVCPAEESFPIRAFGATVLCVLSFWELSLGENQCPSVQAPNNSPTHNERSLREQARHSPLRGLGVPSRGRGMNPSLAATTNQVCLSPGQIPRYRIS